MSDLPDDADLVAVPDDSDLVPVVDQPADEDLVAVPDDADLVPVDTSLSSGLPGGDAPVDLSYRQPAAEPRKMSSGLPGGDAPVDLARSRLTTSSSSSRRSAGRPGISSGAVDTTGFEGFTAADISNEVRDTAAAHRRAELQAAFDGLREGGGKSERALRVHKSLGITYSDALANLAEFEDAALAAANNPETFEKENPELANILRKRPELTELVTTKTDIALSLQLWNKLRLSLGRPDPKAAGDFARMQREAEAQRDEYRAQQGLPPLPKTAPDEAQVVAATAEQQTEFDAEQKKLEAPNKVTQLDDPKAKLGKSQGALMRQFYRAKEVWDQGEVQEQGEKLMLAEVQYGTDSREAADARGKYEDLKASHVPRAYGDDTGLEHQVAIAVQGGYSTVAMGASSVKGATAAGAAGLVVGGAAGYALEGPAGVLEGMALGAETLGSAGGTIGLHWGAFRMELQPTYEQNLALVTDAGKHMTPREAFGMAIFQSGIKAGLESFSFGVQTAALKGGAAALVQQAEGLAVRNPTFRAKLAELAVEWVKGGASEGLTGGAQSLVEQLGELILKVGKDTLEQKPAFGGPMSIRLQNVDLGEAVARTVTDAEQEAVGGFGFGGLTTAGGIAMHGAATIGITQSIEARSEYVTQQTGAILKIAQSEGADLMAPELAAEVERKTAETGAPIKSVHVPGDEIITFLQKDERTPAQVDEEITKALGPEGVAKVREAASTGAKIEISLEQAFSTWGKSEVGRALADVTTTDPTALTPKELREKKAEIEAQARELADGVGKKMAAEEETTGIKDTLEQELRAAGASRKESAAVATLWHHFWRVAGKEFGIDPKELFATFRTRFFRGDNLSADSGGRTAESMAREAEAADAASPVVGEDAGAAVQEAYDRLATPEARAGVLYTDKVTGLRTPRAWGASPRVAGKVVAAITTPDVKPVNDHEFGGHDAANDLLRVIGGVVGGADAEAAREGTTFLLHVADQAELDQVLENIRKKSPAGLAIDGAVVDQTTLGQPNKDGVARTAEMSAKDALEAGIEAKRTAGTYAPRAEAKTNVDTSRLTDPAFRFSTDDAALDGNVSDALLSTVASGDTAPGQFEDRQTFIKEAFYDKAMPGTMSAAGFDAVGERDYVVAFDGIGLKALNDRLGKDAGNAFLAVISQAARDMGGEGLFFAHLSGDEFAAKSDNKAALESFASDLYAALTDASITIRDESGATFVVTPELRHGIGEKTYGRADRALNAAKRSETARGVIRKPAFGEVAGDVSQLPGRADLAAVRRRVEARRGEQTDVGSGSTEAGAADFNPEDLSPGSTRPASKSEHTPEQMAEARAWVDRKRPGNRARFNRYLDFVAGWSRGVERPAGRLTSTESRELAKDFGIIDPQYGFALHQATDAPSGYKGATTKSGSQPVELAKHRPGITDAEVEILKSRMNQSDAGPRWFSQVEKAVESAKQERNTGAAWWAFLQKAAGVKAEELHLLGIEAWLLSGKDSLGRAVKSLTKSDLSEFIMHNKVQVTEKVLGEGGGEQLPSRGLHNRFEDVLSELEDRTDEGGDRFLDRRHSRFRDMQKPFDIIGAARDASQDGNYDAALSMLRNAAFGQGLGENPFPELIAKVEETARSPGTLYGSYQLDGAEPGSYRELLFYTPKSAGFDSGHFGSKGKGLLAHARISEHRDSGGERVLFIEEIQSDLHQSGRNHGYAKDTSEAEVDLKEWLEDGDNAYDVRGREGAWFAVSAKFEVWDEASFATRAEAVDSARAQPHVYKKRPVDVTNSWLLSRNPELARRLVREDGGTVPDAPFKQSWEELAAKRVLMLAAEKGIRKIGWTTGATQADRYDLSKKVDAVMYQKNSDGTHNLLIWIDGRRQSLGESMSDAQLEASVGKDVAERIVADEGKKTNIMGNDARPGEETWGSLAGSGLAIGGEGMAAAYDVRLPSVFKKLVKKDGGTVQHENLDTGVEVWTATVPESLIKTTQEQGQPLFQPGDATDTPSPKDDPSVPRGYYMPSATQMQHFLDIFRNDKADYTTVIHEMGHAFLDIQQALAARADAPMRAREKWQAFLDWAKVTDAQWSALDTDGKRKFHEKFAESFEVYMRTGKAPSVALRSVFSRFRLWITQIFATLRDQNREELDPKLARIFDRMLALDEETARALGERGPRLFDNAKDAGMTEAEWQAQMLEEGEEAEFHTEKARLFALKDEQRETEQWWLDELRVAKDQAEAAYDELPAERARVVLEGNDELQLPAVLLDRAEVEKVVGRKAAKGLRTTWFGTSLAQAAELTDFTGGGDALVKALLAHPKREVWVQKQAEDTMATKWPNVLQRRAELAKLVTGGLHSLVERRIIEEWASIRAKGPKPGMGAAVAPAEALKRAAELMAERRAVSSLNGARVLAAERKAAGEKAKAGVKGEHDKAQAAALRELLNAYLYREVLKARDEATALEERAADMGAKKAQARLGKASPEYRDAVAFLLETLGLKKSTGEITADVLGRAVAQMNGDGVVIGDPEWKTALDGLLRGEPEFVTGDRMAPLNLGRLTVKGMRAVSDALKGLEAAARARTTFLVEGKRVDREATISEALLAIEEHKGRRPPTVTKGTETAGELIRNKLNSWDGFLRNPIDLVRELTADNHESILWKVVVNPMRRAKFREAEILKKTIAPIIDAMERMPKKMKEAISQPVDGRGLFPNHTEDFGVPRTRWELLVMALNSGNDSNMQRLTDGRNISVVEVRNALNLLTKEEIAWVQTVFDAAESLKPEAFDIEERLTGLRPEAIKAKPMELTNGRLLGGYFPAVYERTSQAGEKQAAGQLAQLSDPSYVRPGTPHSHLKGRADKVKAIISLSPGAVYAHMAQVAHDIAFREVLQSVGSFVLDKRIDAALKQRLGEAKAGEFLQWLKDVGGAATPASNPMSKAIQFVRGNLAPAVLGWRASTALGDFANLPAAVASTKLEARHLAAGIRATMFGFGETREAALEKSAELRNMADNTKQMFATAMKDFTDKRGWKGALNRGPMGWYRDHAFSMMEAVSIATATPVWLGAYNQALAAGKEDAAAARWADDILTQVFPSHSPVEQAGILRDKGVAGLSTVFYGYLSVAYRSQSRILSELTSSDFAEDSTKGKAATVASVSGRLLGFYVAYQVLGELLMGRGPEDGDDDPEERGNKLLRWRNWFMRKLLSAPLQTVPVLGDLAPTIDARLTGRPPRAREGILSSYLREAATALLDIPDPDVATQRKLEGLLRVIGGTFGIPISPVQNLKYLLEATVGDRAVPTPFHFASGIVWGERDNQPDTPLTAIGDAYKN